MLTECSLNACRQLKWFLPAAAIFMLIILVANAGIMHAAISLQADTVVKKTGLMHSTSAGGNLVRLGASDTKLDGSTMMTNAGKIIRSIYIYIERERERESDCHKLI